MKAASTKKTVAGAPVDTTPERWALRPMGDVDAMAQSESSRPQDSSSPGARNPARPDSDGELRVRSGHEPGKSFRVKCATELANRQRAGGAIEGEIDHWRRVAVIYSAGPVADFWVLEPSTQENAIEIAGCYVRGRFRIVEEIREGDAARAAWKAFRPE